MKTLTQTLAVCLLTMGSATYVMAQADVNPDHFQDEPMSASLVQVNLQAEIQQEESRIRAYESQLRAKYEQVEKARNEAISAGIQGDAAECFTDEYHAQMKQLGEMWQSLRAQIVMARNDIASLQARIVMVAGTGDKSAPVVAGSRKAPALVMASSKSTHVVAAR